MPSCGTQQEQTQTRCAWALWPAVSMHTIVQTAPALHVSSTNGYCVCMQMAVACVACLVAGLPACGTSAACMACQVQGGKSVDPLGGQSSFWHWHMVMIAL